MKLDTMMEYLLDQDGMTFVIDENLGLWVRFYVKEVDRSVRRNSLRYSLTLHNHRGERILGFDNAHEIEYGGKQNVAPVKILDHWHFDENDIGHPYDYTTAGKLLTDFWIAVNKKTAEIKERLLCQSI